MTDIASLSPNQSQPDQYLEGVFRDKGIGGWRSLYLKFFDALKPGAIVEVGSGAPDFLLKAKAPRAVAVDAGDFYRGAFERAGIAFFQKDLERDRLNDVGEIDVAVCSDVFEHLVNPMFALESIARILPATGILFNHVPNEYRLSPAFGIMLGRRKTTQFHGAAQEWNDPHVRRFSERGYLAFLQHHFAFNLRLTDLRYAGLVKWMDRFGIAAPYCLQGGPTFASCNDRSVYENLIAIKKKIKNAKH